MGITNNLSRSVNRLGLKFKKNSPTILVVAGGIGMVVSAVFACKKTLTIKEKLAEPADDLKHARICHDELDEDDYSLKDYRSDITRAYGKIALVCAKEYGPSIILASASLGMIFASHGILRQRNAGIAAAYSLMQQGYGEYRKRVRDELGEDIDRHFLYGTNDEDVEFIENDEHGNEKKVKKNASISDDPKNKVISPYAKFFDESSREWDPDPNYNLNFLLNLQEQMTWMLQSKGHLFLNEVYDALGIPRTPEGCVVGWLYEPDWGCDHVDFGIHNIYSRPNRAFVNGQEANILLDFNVYGNIQNLI